MTEKETTHMVRGIYLQVRPQKLSNSVLEQVYNSLQKHKRLPSNHKFYVNQSEKVWYLNTYKEFVPIRLEEGDLSNFIEKFSLNLNDIKNVKGGTQVDLQALSDASFSELDNTNQSFIFPASRIKQDPNKTLEQSILATIDEMDSDPRPIAEDNPANESINVIEAAEITPLESKEEYQRPAQISNFSLSSSLLDTGIQDSFFQRYPDRPKAPTTTTYQPSANRESKEVPVMNATLKLDATQAIPTWQKGNTTEENARLTERYIRDLKRVKKLDVGKSDGWIINTSLLKSGKSDFYMELPAGADEDLNSFIDYLTTAYGQSKVSKRRFLADVRQEIHESPHSFLSRVINLYYDVRGETAKTTKEIENNDNEAFDILSLYLKGLRNSKVRTLLKARIDELDLQSIADETRNISEAYAEGDNNDHVVNLISSTSNMNNKIDTLSKEIETISVNFAKIRNPSWNRQNNNYNRRPYRGFNKFNNNYRRGTNSYYQNRRGYQSYRGSNKHRSTNNNNYHRNNQTDRKSDRKNEKEKPKFQGKCYNCGLFGHRQSECKKPRSS